MPVIPPIPEFRIRLDYPASSHTTNCALEKAIPELVKRCVAFTKRNYPTLNNAKASNVRVWIKGIGDFYFIYNNTPFGFDHNESEILTEQMKDKPQLIVQPHPDTYEHNNINRELKNALDKVMDLCVELIKKDHPGLYNDVEPGTMHVNITGLGGFSYYRNYDRKDKQKSTNSDD